MLQNDTLGQIFPVSLFGPQILGARPCQASIHPAIFAFKNMDEMH